MYLRLLASASCVVVCGLLPRGGLIAQGAPTPDGAPPRWVSATRPWLLGQIIPNRLVPDPDPSRRRLVISYDLAPAEFPRRFHRSATYDDALVELYRDELMLAVSIENNISAWFFLHQLADLTREARWAQAADRIRRGLLQSAWNDSLGQFNQGFAPLGDADPDKALDCAAWGALFLLAAGEPQRAQQALAAADRYYVSKHGDASGYRPYAEQAIYGDPEVGRVFFHESPRKQWRELPIVWSEGTLGVALAYLRMGQSPRARQIVAGLAPLQAANGGLRCASQELQYEMTQVPCVAASAWLVLGAEALAGNPVAMQVWN